MTRDLKWGNTPSSTKNSYQELSKKQIERCVARKCLQNFNSGLKMIHTADNPPVFVFFGQLSEKTAIMSYAYDTLNQKLFALGHKSQDFFLKHRHEQAKILS